VRVKLADSEARKTIDRFVAMDESGQIPGGYNVMLRRVVDWYRWLACGGCIIRNVHQQLVRLVPNRTQRALIATFMLQAAAGRPLRVVVFKARKVGVSTLVDSLGVFLAAHYPYQICGMMAHIASSTTEIFDIAKTIHNGWTAIRYGLSQARLLKFQESRFWAHTAGGTNTGAGGTPSFLHLSEFALWSRNARDTEAAAVNSLPYVPQTVLVVESSCRGRNRFWDYWEGSLRKDSQYDGLFVPWYYDETLSAPVNYDVFAMTDDERALARRAGSEGIEITPEMFQWRRGKIDEIGAALFRQEYPSTPEEALEAYSGLVLPGLRECGWDGRHIAMPADVGGWDFGFSDPAAMIHAYWEDRCLFLFGEFRKSGTVAADQAKACHDGCKYWTDPANTSSRMELEKAVREAGKHATFAPAPRRKTDREQTYVDNEFAILRKMITEGRMFVHHDTCEQLLTEADSLLYDENTGKPDYRRNERVGHFDTVDALRYLGMGVDRGSMASPVRAPMPTRERDGLRR